MAGNACLLARVSRAFSFLLAFACILASAQESAAQDRKAVRLSYGTRPADFDRPQAALDSPPVLSEDFEVPYPEAEQRRGHTGIVIVQAAIDEQGEVVYAIVTKHCGFPALDSAALRAVTQARFKPARRDGRSVAARMTIPVEFTTSIPDQVHDVEKTQEELRDDVRRLEKSKKAAEEEQRKIEEEIRRLKHK